MAAITRRELASALARYESMLLQRFGPKSELLDVVARLKAVIGLADKIDRSGSANDDGVLDLFDEALKDALRSAERLETSSESS